MKLIAIEKKESNIVAGGILQEIHTYMWMQFHAQRRE
jgi:hypothetical protein